MRVLVAIAFVLACAVSLVFAASDAESEIQAVLNTQVDAWNRGDIPTFVDTYAPDCIFVGKQIIRGRDQVLARYRKSYPTREAMGHLIFSALEVHLLTPDVALVTGAWHLERPASAGNQVGGLFSLVFHRHVNQWRIALDHTS
jgi:uncharacterized protein (TIGR02246 family)